MRRYTIDLNAANPPAPPADLPATQPAVALAAAGATRTAATAQPGEARRARRRQRPANRRLPLRLRRPPQRPRPSRQQPRPASDAAPRVEAPEARCRGARASAAASSCSSAAFGSRDNADRLVRDMTAKGFAAFVAPIKSGGRELYRVRVGPTRDRAQAEALAAQLGAWASPAASCRFRDALAATSLLSAESVEYNAAPAIEGAAA